MRSVFAERAAEGARLLKQGNYREGFPLFDQLRADPGYANKAPVLPFPRWRGEPVAGKTVLIWSEHGFGDQIMYARFAKQLVERGARVQWACPRALARLLETLGIEVFPGDEPFELSGCDFYVPSSALPLGFDISEATLPQPPYFEVAPTAYHGRIGVMTAGSKANPLRSLSDDLAVRLLALPGAVSLDPSATQAEDFFRTAQIIARLDLIISVDTAVAHLAGAMGRPLIVLLPFDADWRWGRGDRSPWYPEATLFRQGADRAWAPVIDKVLARRANASPSTSKAGNSS